MANWMCLLTDGWQSRVNADAGISGTRIWYILILHIHN